MVALARDGADVVSASRYMRGGHQIGGPPLKRLMSRTAGLTLHWFAGVPTHDPTNNFKLYSRRFLDTVTIESTAGFELALELTVKATLAGSARRRGPHDLARPDGRPEQLQAPQVAAALPALVSDGVRRTARVGAGGRAGMIGRMRVAFARIGLPAWFIVIDLLWIAKPDVLGIDARHYQRAASEWLAGGDPWKVTEGGIPFAAGPHTLLFYAPTSVLPLSVSVAVWMVLGVAAAVWMVRRLDIPLWWIALPAPGPRALERQPAEHRAGAPGGRRDDRRDRRGRAEALRRRAPGLPAAPAGAGHRRPRRRPAAPAVAALHQRTASACRATSRAPGTAAPGALPILIPPTLLGLWILRHKGAEWFAVPAVWPATQFYYVSMAMPAVISMPVRRRRARAARAADDAGAGHGPGRHRVRQTGLAAALGRATRRAGRRRPRSTFDLGDALRIWMI